MNYYLLINYQIFRSLLKKLLSCLQFANYF